MITIKRISAKIILSMKIHETLVRLEICEFSAFLDLTHTLQNLYVMALRQKIEWDPEEVAAGYDLSSIYEGVGENDTVPVISSVVNTTDQAGSAINMTAGLNNFVRDVVEQVVAFTINTTTTTPSSLVNHTSEQVSSTSVPSIFNSIVKKVAEHLGKEPKIPVVTVCIFFKEYYSFCTICKIYNHTVLYIS